MLYDILSPLIFFLSLGGILLIIGRVVIRVRREQFSTSLSAMHAASANAKGLSASFGTREVSNVLRPNQKSVQFIRTRMSYLAHVLTQGARDVRGLARRIKVRRQAPVPETVIPETPPESPPTVAVPSAQEAPDVLTPTTEQVITLPGTSRFSRLFSGSRRLFRRRGEAVVDDPTGTSSEAAAPEPLASTSLSTEAAPARSRWRLRRVNRPAAVAPATVPPETGEGGASPTDASSAALPAQPSSLPGGAPKAERVTKRRNWSHALRPAHPEKSAVPTALTEATGALAQRHFRQAEDVLVPYIVKHPKDTAAYMLLGRAAVGRKAWLEAMEIYEQVVTWNEDYEGAYAALGYAAYRARRFTRALQAFQRAHEAAPTDVTILEYLLSIAQKMDNPALQHSIAEKLDQLKATAEPPANTKTRASARI